MIEQNPIVEDGGQSLGVSMINQKSQHKDGRRDFSVVKLQRISKLQQILSKNLKLREGSVSNKQKQQYPLIQRSKPTYKRSLPLIRHSEQFREQVHNQNNYNNNSHFSQQNDNPNSLLKKYRQKLVLNNKYTGAFINYEPDIRILENPQSQQTQQHQRSILKLKVRNLQLEEQVKKVVGDNRIKKLKSSMSKQSIGKSSIQRVASIQRLILNNKQGDKQKSYKKDFRRKCRNASTLNLTKIQHLPQILFPIHKNCTKSKFPSMSMAQIDHNLLTHEIFEMEEKRVIEVKNREKKERILKDKIKAHHKSYFREFICQ